jgi:hypothetical protein
MGLGQRWPMAVQPGARSGGTHRSQPGGVSEPRSSLQMTDKVEGWTTSFMEVTTWSGKAESGLAVRWGRWRCSVPVEANRQGGRSAGDGLMRCRKLQGRRHAFYRAEEVGARSGIGWSGRQRLNGGLKKE